MDLLSAIGVVTKRRSDFFGQAETLAKKTGSQEALEERMTIESKALVKGLRDKQLKWDEYERSLMEKTLVSALSGVYLGAGEANPRGKMEKAWGSIVGDIMPPLIAFIAETKSYIDQGLLRIGDSTEDFADWDQYLDDFEIDEEDLLDPFEDVGPNKKRGASAPADAAVDLSGRRILTDPEDPGKYQVKNPEAKAASVSSKPGGHGRTWRGLLTRVGRYLATPSYGFFQMGRFFRKQEQGYKEMRRVAILDKKACQDCRGYDAQGWQPLGSLPMPGHGCRCYDRCRCHIEYR